MRSPAIPLAFSLILLVSIQLRDALPLQNTALTTEDMDVLKLLLQGLEDFRPASSPDQRPSQEVTSPKETQIQPQTRSDLRRYLSARDLKSVRQDPKKYSGCFGHRLDRIGSMSSLGCNTARRSSPKKK